MKEYYTLQEIADRLDIKPDRILREVERKQINAVNVSGEWQIPMVEWNRIVRERIFKPWSASGVHQKVLELLQSWRKGRILDLGAGSGFLSYVLKEMGFAVTACDIHPGRFLAPGLSCDRVDLNKDLPYDDSSFDCVLCLDVLEHLESTWHITREIRRVLRVGGKAVFSTPNISHIQSRLFYLLTGQFAGFKRGDYEKGHIHPIYPIYLDLVLHDAGLAVELITYNRGWIYTAVARHSLLAENGFEVPLRNKWFGQVLIAVATKAGSQSVQTAY